MISKCPPSKFCASYIIIVTYISKREDIAIAIPVIKIFS